MTAGNGKPVAFLGTGMMGLPMARNAAQAGLRVRAWDRTREKAGPLAELGVRIADTPAEAAAEATIVVTMLADAEAVLNAIERGGAIAAMAPDAVWAQMSTIGIEGIDRCAALARERGVPLMDAPVLGTRQPAVAGELTVLAAGPSEAVDRCQPLFEAVGSRTVRLGEVGEATRLKLVLNTWLVTLVEAVAETVAFAEGLGLDPALFLETIKGGPLDVAYAHTKGRAMIERDFPPAFKLSLALKDARLVRDAARAAGLDLALIEAVLDRFERAVELGHGDEDLAAAYWASSRAASSLS
jgi:3-hydroxyisobutyrate dehydrogenase